MPRYPVILLAVITALAGMPGAWSQAGRAAAPSLEQRVAAQRKRAEQLAAREKWRDALGALASAKEQVRVAQQRELRHSAGGARPSAQHLKELRALQRWAAEQHKLSQQGKADPQQLARTYEQRKAALDRKYAGSRPKPLSPKQRAAQRARFDLLLASLDDSLSAVYTKKGEMEHARAARREALKTRLQAYQALGKPTLATGAAEKALSVAANDPVVHKTVGTFYQEQSQFGRSAAVWESVVRLIETGKAQFPSPGGRPLPPSYKNLQLAECYRNLAYCYSRLGRSAEVAPLLEKAKKAEETAHAQLKRR
jgi:tetratricopeptide (TPR) repeat protein